MKKKLFVIPLMLVIALFALQACAPAEPAAPVTAEPTAADTATPAPATAQPTQTPADSGEIVLTLEELSQYNGKDGNPAYVAVDGVIYDVSDASPWFQGDHNGFTAGNDLTEEIKNVSPHGVSKLRGLPVVGKLAE